MEISTSEPQSQSLVDLIPKDGGGRWSTQSFDEYLQKRGDQSEEVSQQTQSRDQCDLQSLEAGIQRGVGRYITGDRSSSKAIIKMERRVRRSKRKNKKKKHIAEFGAETDNLILRKKERPFLFASFQGGLEDSGFWSQVRH